MDQRNEFTVFPTQFTDENFQDIQGNIFVSEPDYQTNNFSLVMENHNNHSRNFGQVYIGIYVHKKQISVVYDVKMLHHSSVKCA